MDELPSLVQKKLLDITECIPYDCLYTKFKNQAKLNHATLRVVVTLVQMLGSVIGRRPIG